MTTAVGLISLTLVASIASAQGRGGGGGGATGGGGTSGGTVVGAPGGTTGGRAVGSGQPGVGQPVTTIPPTPQPSGRLQPQGAPPAGSTLVGQPLTPPQPSVPSGTAGDALPAGGVVGSQFPSIGSPALPPVSGPPVTPSGSAGATGGTSGGTVVGGPGGTTGGGTVGTGQPGVGQPVTTIPSTPQPSGRMQPQGAPSATSTLVGQPLTPQQPSVPSGTEGADAQPAGATFPSAGFPALLPGLAGSPMTPPSDQAGAAQGPPSPLVISAPASSTTAPVASAMAAAMPPDALGVVVESMMLANVTGLDTERGCVTVRALNGDSTSYRIESPVDGNVAIGDAVVIEVARPLFASTGDAPSASPRMAEPQAPPRAGASSSALSSARAEKRTTISTAARPTIISSNAVRCATR